MKDNLKDDTRFNKPSIKELEIYNIDSPKQQWVKYLNNIHYKIKGDTGKIDISEMNLVGEHNILNIMACLGSAKVFDVDDASIEKTVKNFKTLRHRIEFIEIINNIRCFNDSKATNPDSTIKALSSFKKEEIG